MSENTDSFSAATKIIPDRASVYTQELINLVPRALFPGFSRPTSKAPWGGG